VVRGEKGGVRTVLESRQSFTPKFRSVTYFRVYLYSTLTPHTTNLPQIYFAICFRRGLLHGA
jgi:hypothetical protein